MKILLRSSKNAPWKMVDSVAYGAEAELQRLLAETPTLISLDEVRPGSSPLFAAVSEFSLPIGFIDLLAFNVEGDIAIIECKLAANPEIKRKVIGQVLEYGAYLWQMTYEQLDLKVKARTGKHLAELMQGAFSTAEDEERFRGNVEAALESGKFILMIVVDEINEELGKIVNYLNVCGNPAFAFAALEMRRFQKDEIEMLVPHVLGTPPIKVNAASGSSKQWDEKSFFQSTIESQSTKTVKIVEDLYQWSKRYASRLNFGVGTESGSFTFHYVTRNGIDASIFSVKTNGKITFNLGFMDKIFSKDTIGEFRRRLDEILTYDRTKSLGQYYFTIEIDKAFDKPGSLEQFKQAVLDLKNKFL